MRLADFEALKAKKTAEVKKISLRRGERLGLTGCTGLKSAAGGAG